MKSLAFIATAFLAAVNAASVTFKVIAPNATDSVQVNINGALTSLNASDPDVPYYTGTAEYDLGANYKVKKKKNDTIKWIAFSLLITQNSTLLMVRLNLLTVS